MWLFISVLSVLVPMLVIDGVWLGFMVKNFYQPRLGHLMADAVSFTPAVAFYLIYAFALSQLVVWPSIRDGASVLNVFLMGMLFGLAAYGTYDLTNQATLKAWPLEVTIVDMAWGSLLTGTLSVLSAQILKRLL